MTANASQLQRTLLALSRHRLLPLLVRGCATTAIVFGAPVNLRTLSDFGPPR